MRLRLLRMEGRDKGEHRFMLYDDSASGFDRFSLRLSFYWKHRVSNGFSISFGNRSSETPIDAHIAIGPFAAFSELNFKNLGKLCETIGHGHKRELSLKIHGGSLWWKLWYNDDMGYDSYHRCDSWRKPKVWPWSMGRKKHRSWMCLRDGSIDLNPVDAFWGGRYFEYEDIETVTSDVLIDWDIPNDDYEVTWTLQKQTRARRYGPKWARKRTDEGYVASWRTPGIPIRNHSWKGDDVLASAESVTNLDNWLEEAEKSLVEHILKDRAHYNYRYHAPEEV